MTLKELISHGAEKLKKKGIKTYQLDSLVLTAFLFKKSKEWIFLNSHNKITKNQKIKFDKLIARRSKHEPIAYLLGLKEFYGLNFEVNKNVLIPKPETEELIDLAISLIKKKRNKLKIADLGTGSGCIAIVLKKIVPEKISTIYATDISKKALQIAKNNARLNQVRDIKFLRKDLLGNLKNLDLIISNPPYIREGKKLPQEVMFQPKRALFTNHHFSEKFLGTVHSSLKPKGIALVEIDPSQIKEFKKIIKDKNLNFKIKTAKDLYAKNRFLILTRAG